MQDCQKLDTALAVRELFTTNNSEHGRPTRQSDELHLPRVRTEAGKSAVSYRAEWRGIHFHMTSAVPSPCQPGRSLLKYTSTL